MTPLPWSFPEALEMMRAIEAHAQYCGYKAALGGSVSRAGVGRDLDVFLIPKRPKEFRACAAGVIATVKQALRASVSQGPAPCCTGDVSVILVLYDGRVIDLSVVGAEPEPAGYPGYDAPIVSEWTHERERRRVVESLAAYRASLDALPEHTRRALIEGTFELPEEQA